MHKGAQIHISSISFNNKKNLTMFYPIKVFITRTFPAQY